MKPQTYFIGTRWAQSPTAQYFYALGHVLVEKGHKVIILVSDQRNDVEDHQSNPAIYTWPSKTPTRLHDALFFYSLVKRYHPDVVIANFSSVNIMLVEGWLFGIPVRVAWYRSMLQSNLMNITGGDLKTTFMRLRRRLVYRFATRIITNSKASQEDLNREYGVRKDKTKVIYNSLADTIIPKDCVRPEKNLLVCVGRFMPSKGQDILIRAIALLKENQPNLKVEFIGKITRQESYAQEMQTLAQELDVKKNCIFTGAIPHNKVLEHMSRAWATIFPTRSEAFGLVNIESMSVGTPVIASKVGGIPEVIRDGVDGILVPAEDPERLADAIQQILTNEPLHKRMTIASRQHFLDLFEQSRVIESQAEWFINLASKVRK